MRPHAVFVVVTEISAKPGRGDELEGMFRDIVEWVADNEPETLTYTCCRATDDRERFVFFERYASEAALRAHAASEKFLALTAALHGRIEGAVLIRSFEEIAAKR